MFNHRLYRFCRLVQHVYPINEPFVLFIHRHLKFVRQNQIDWIESHFSFVEWRSPMCVWFDNDLS